MGIINGNNKWGAGHFPIGVCYINKICKQTHKIRGCQKHIIKTVSYFTWSEWMSKRHYSMIHQKQQEDLVNLVKVHLKRIVYSPLVQFCQGKKKAHKI